MSERRPDPDRQILLLPDAGPLITLAYADALDLLLAPGWALALVDMVLHEVTRNETPTSQRLGAWANHKIARASFLLPDNCRKVSTRAFLTFLEQQGWLSSAAEIEGRAIRAGRRFSQLRFPP